MDVLALLTGSRVRADVLTAMFGGRSRSWRPLELERATRRPHSPIYRELRRLATAGLLHVTLREGKRTYEPDADGPVARELTRLVLQTRGRVPKVRHALIQLRSRTIAWACGSAVGPARGRSALIVLTGAPKSLVRVQLANLIEPTTELHCMSVPEWVARLEKGDLLVTRARRARKLWILGSWEELTSRERSELGSKELLRTVRRNWREELSDEWDEDWDPFARVPGPA